MKAPIFLNAPEDCAWLRETHLKGLGFTSHSFASFLLFGNEDCPSEVHLFSHADPLVTDRPQRIFLNETPAEFGDYRTAGEASRPKMTRWQQGGAT